MLDELVRTVEKLRERIRTHRDSIGGSEFRTRVSLIDPMLCALGWEVGDPAQVALEKEQRDEAGRPDYALLGATGKPVLLIEAKRLGVTRGPIRQLTSYVLGENFNRDYKVPFCAWSDGDIWQVADVRDQEVVIDLQLSRDDPPDCAFKLLGLWKNSLVGARLRTPVKLTSRSGAEPSARRVPPAPRPRRRRSSNASEVDATAARTVEDAARLRSLDLLGEPKSIAFPGEPEQPLRNQKELIVSVANHLVRTNRLTADNGTLPSGPKRYLVHSSPEHPSGKRFKASVELDNGLYLETSNPFSQQIKYACKLLDRYGAAGLAGRVLLDRWTRGAAER